MNDPLTDATPPALVAAMEANHESAAIAWGHLLGKEFHEGLEQTWFCSGYPYHLFNGVIRTRPSPERADDAIEEMLENFKQRGAPFAWLIGPSTQPADLSERLERHGLRLDDDEPGITLAPLQAARALGYRFGVLQATTMGRPIYEKLGFREYCRFQLYFS